MVACAHCKKKNRIMLKCTSCTNEYCSGCIQLEVHMCANMNLKIEKERKILEEKNTRVVSKKI